MKLTQNQIDFMLSNDNGIVVLASATPDGKPRTCLVRARFLDGEMVIADAQMGQTLDNIKNNSNIQILSCAKDYSRWLKISGEAEYSTAGKVFDHLVSVSDPAFPIKGALAIAIENIEDITD